MPLLRFRNRSHVLSNLVPLLSRFPPLFTLFVLPPILLDLLQNAFHPPLVLLFRGFFRDILQFCDVTKTVEGSGEDRE